MNDKTLRIFDPYRMIPTDMFGRFLSDFDVHMNTEIEMYEDDDEVVVRVKAPGYKSNNIDISVDNKVLTISGNIESNAEENDKRKYYYREIRNESFTRSVTLPSSVKADEAKADFEDGILKISLPKTEEVKPKRIMISNK